jgi:tRNA A-37 threonylcarbamoyl transferase component Bud32
MVEPLTEDEVARHLAGRGIIDAGDRVVGVDRLAGGISGDTFAAHVAGAAGVSPHRALVVKRALPQLRVSQRWDANPRRTVTEGLALRLVASLAPGEVPDVVDIDPVTNTLTLRHAEPGWTDWKSQLLDGRIDPRVGARVGTLLGTIHRRTWNDPALEPTFGDRTGFEALRLVAYHEAAGRARPELATAIRPYLDELRRPGERRCLVHGDASPKNVLVGPSGPAAEPELWLIDFEAAHMGDPVFDPAFLVNHLVLKTVHGLDAQALHRTAEDFWSAYRDVLGTERAPTTRRLLGHVGCLMLARVVGWSRVEYLDEGGRHVALRLGNRLASRPPDVLGGAWELIHDLGET